MKAGGAEQRFLEVAKRWEANEALQHTVLEPLPALHDSSVSLAVPYTDPSLLNDLLEGSLYGIAAFLEGRKRQHDLVLATNNILPHVVAAFLLARIRQIPWVVVVHHFEVLAGGTVEQTLLGIYRAAREQGRLRAFVRAVANRIAIWLVRKADGVIAVSPAFANLFDQAVVSGNGIDHAKFDGVLASHRHRQACFVGRLNHDKGVFDLLAAWERLKHSRESGLRLFLMGQDQVGIEKEIVRRGLEKTVAYLGEVSEEEKIQRLKGSSLFVTASRSEGWGISIAEALAAGLRVVCYDLPTLRPLWGSCPHVTLIPLGSVDKLAEEIATLAAAEPPSPAETRSCVRGMSWEAVAARDWTFLLHVLQSAESPRSASWKNAG